METGDIIEQRDGDGTARAAKMLIKHLEGKPVKVYSDHSSKAETDNDIGHIVSWYFSVEGWKAALSQIDIAVVDESEPERALALIEIEETNERPKNLLGDVFAVLVGNGIRCNGKDINVGEWTRIIVLAKRSIVRGNRIEYLSEKVNEIKAKLGNDVQPVGKIVIRTFNGDLPPEDELSLEFVLKQEVDRALAIVKNPLPESPSAGEVPISLERLENELTEELRGTYDAARERGYVPTYFLQMLEEHGGKETAKRLLAKSEPQTGLFELWNLGLLHESLEAVVLQEKYRVLFDDVDLAEAYRRLEELGYSNQKK